MMAVAVGALLVMATFLMVAPTLWHDFPLKSPGSWAFLHLVLSGASCVRSLRRAWGSWRRPPLPLPLAAITAPAQAPPGSPRAMISSDDTAPSPLSSWEDQELLVTRDRQDECMWHLLRTLAASQDDRVSSTVAKLASQLIHTCAGTERSYVQVVDAAPLMLGLSADMWPDLLSVSDLPVAVTSAICPDMRVSSHLARQGTAIKLRRRISQVPQPVRAHVLKCYDALTASADARHPGWPPIRKLSHCRPTECAFQR
jgi:hypothetical protein